MPVFILYLLKLSISLMIVWLFYQLFLRRLTFYSLNRWYLLGYSVLCFFIPLINIGQMVEEDPSHQPLVIQFIPSIGNYSAAALPAAGWQPSWNVWSLLLAAIGLGSILLLIRSAVRWRSLRRIRQQAVLLEDRLVKIYQVDDDIIPFSFGKAIYINQHLHTEKEWEEIILHEYVHIQQKHTADILLAELLCALNWYNPFAWLIRHSIRQNLEFIADNKVLENGIDKKNYQYHLLKVIGKPSYSLTNNFNFSSLKKRIVMMNKIKSARLHLLKFMFILPLMAVLLLAFRDQYKGIFRRPGETIINDAGIVSDVITHQPIAGVSVVERTTGLTTTTDANGFYHLKLPVRFDSIRINLYFNKQGYDSSTSSYFNPSVKESRGLIDLPMMTPTGGHSPYMMVFPYMQKGMPVDPVYEEVLAACKEQFRQLDGWNSFFAMEKKHPEVALFYNAEGNTRHIVIRKDGEVEKYGGPGDQPMAEMEKKYGPLSSVITTPSTQVSAGYLSRWQKIAEEAEKEFHTTNPDARHIIFPGDSRVLVVPVSGKPEIYDMENADPKERPSFEALYGKLPDCVPSPTLSTHTGKLATPAARPTSLRNSSLKTDTVPKNKTTASDSSSRRPVSVTILRRQEPPANVLYVINGKPMDKGWKMDSIATDDIATVNVIRDNADTRQLYGERGANGVIEITTKSYLATFSRLHPIDPEDPLHTPLYVIDGVPTGRTAMQSISPDQILSIEVLKGDKATESYGDNAHNGVVIIHTKRKIVAAGQPTMILDTKDGKVTVTADTIRVPTMGATIFNSNHQ